MKHRIKRTCKKVEVFTNESTVNLNEIHEKAKFHNVDSINITGSCYNYIAVTRKIILFCFLELNM